MRLAFFGTSSFAVPSLRALLRSPHQVALCVTQPERPRGRGLRRGPSPVETLARAAGLPLFQPADPSAPSSVARIAEARPELLVVVAYGCILRRPLLDAAPHGAVSAHPSLLPRYRGAAPIAWALINGDRTTGVSVFRLRETVDTGDLIAQQETAIGPEETAVALAARLADDGAALLVESIDLLTAGRVCYRPQSSAGGSYARKLRKTDGRIDWRWPAPQIHNLVRGTQPWPGAQTWWRGKRLTLWRTRLSATDVAAKQAGLAPDEAGASEPGAILQATPAGVLVASGAGGRLVIEEVQAAGGRRMPAAEFLRGHRLAAGERLSADP